MIEINGRVLSALLLWLLLALTAGAKIAWRSGNEMGEQTGYMRGYVNGIQSARGWDK